MVLFLAKALSRKGFKWIFALGVEADTGLVVKACAV